MIIGKDAPVKGEMLLQRSDEPSVQGGQQPPGTRLPELPGGAAAGANGGASETTDAREVGNPPAWFSWPNQMLDNPDAASDWDEFAKNGAFIDWPDLEQETALTPMQAAQAAHSIDPLALDDPTRCAQGQLPPDLWDASNASRYSLGASVPNGRWLRSSNFSATKHIPGCAERLSLRSR